jgi:hypothetical protein
MDRHPIGALGGRAREKAVAAIYGNGSAVAAFSLAMPADELASPVPEAVQRLFCSVAYLGSPQP